jgi:ABC-type dipeptide/oligopeptide/nickel transport system permease subunit
MLKIILFFPLALITTPQIIPEHILQPPSFEYWLGTNSLGQNLFLLLLKSLGISSIIAFFSVLGSCAIGLFFVYLSQFSKTLSNFFFTLFSGLPNQLIILFLLIFFKSNILLFIIIFAMTSWPGFYKILSEEFQLIQKKDFYLAGYVLGISSHRLFFFYFIPQIQVLLHNAILFFFISSIIQQTSLGFLGISPTDYPSLGAIINEGRPLLFFQPWICFSGLFTLIFFTSFIKYKIKKIK